MPETGAFTLMNLNEHAARIAVEIEAAKREIGTRGFEWYPYGTLTNVPRIEKLLELAGVDLLAHFENGRVVDIGCGDGELSYFLEKLGCDVTAIDYSESNHNGMRGVEALLEKLGSKVAVHNLDLDSGAALPRGDYDIAIFFGVLYHLKNPFLVLERIAQSARYCFLSTRIARRLPDGTSIAQSPVAYLLGETELNNDDSNYWIFSPVALERMLERSHWNVLSSFGAGGGADSDPVSLERDERVFYLLESRYGLKNVELLGGWHALEGSGWRWTERRFTARMAARAGGRLRLRGFVPEVVAGASLSLRMNGREVQSTTLRSTGDVSLDWPIEVDGVLELEFELSRALAPHPGDARELGIIVAGLQIV